jgi:hypothetical protein
MLFVHLPAVLRKLRGKKSLKEIAEGTGLAKEHLALLEPRPPRRHGGSILPERAGKTPRIDTLDILLCYYGISLSELGRLLTEFQDGQGTTPSPPKSPANPSPRKN